ncbi:hypothetical protein [Nocardia sp. XZ_19_385]|uniref:hypothetical protein n=1 Tax=Nocardia sp. XZ_19_385 TaxID=2769488 RepID=UPI0018908A94|nr:hypothetical protein [Nocardia sp. XZ_19_385]
MNKSMITRIAVGAAVVAAGTLSSVTTASAANYGGPIEIGMRCVGLSPNIVDLPYSGTLHGTHGGDLWSGRPAVAVNMGGSIWGYGTHPTLTWTNLATGASGTVTAHGQAGPFFPTDTSFGQLPTGTGPVRFDLSVVNTGLVPVPAITCSGTTEIR